MLSMLCRRIHVSDCLFYFALQVIRESSGDSNSIAAPPQIHIPPPRPKRKPAHPYPRKLGNSLCKDASTIKQLEKPQLKIQLLCEQENCSPKSVLTTAQIGSETMATEGSGSPASSVYMEEKCLTPSTSVGEVALSKVLCILTAIIILAKHMFFHSEGYYVSN
jgi:hypothetical protein